MTSTGGADGPEHRQPVTGGVRDASRAGLPLDPDIDVVEDERHRRRPTQIAGLTAWPDPGSRWPTFRTAMLATVFVGGVMGGIARYAIGEAWTTPPDGFPWATFAINTSGAFALALLLMGIAHVWPTLVYLRPLLGTGFLGAFTTFSAVTTTTQQLVAHGQVATATTYLTASLAAALAATSFGLWLGRTLGSRHLAEAHEERR